MLFSTIIDRELRVSARNWRTYYSRVMVGVWALALSFYLILLARTVFGGAGAGAKIFGASCILALALCLFNGVNRTCDAISSEKREDTLGLLFLTHLKGSDIVLGKLLASGLRTAYLLLAIFPILAIPIFLGGVSGSEFLRAPLVLTNSLFLALSVGLFVSCLTRSQRSAHTASSSIIVTLAILFPSAAYLVQRYAGMPELAMALNLPSPAYALLMSDSTATGLSTNFFWTSLILQFGIAIAALAAACVLTPHTWKTKASNPGKVRDRLARWAHGDNETRATRRRRLLESGPILWLNCRDRFAPLWPILLAVITLCIAVGCIIYFDVPREPAYAILFAAVALNDFSTRIRVGSIASLRLGTDRQSGALELVLSTPLTVEEILSGIWGAIRRKLLWTHVPMLLLYLGVAAFFLDAVVNWHWLIVGYFVVFSLLDFVAMGYMAMWYGMRMRRIQGAAGAALLRVSILPWTLWCMLVPFLQEFQILRGWFDEFGPFGFFVAGVFIWCVSTATAILSARRKLFAHFREAATDRYNFERGTTAVALARRWSDTILTFILLRRGRSSVLN
jgi:hypothetical protein